MARTISPQDVSWFLDLNDKKQLDLDPPYQRRSVWTLKDKRFFIDTILNGYPAPPIFLHKSLDDHGRSTYHVVDGKQRLQTIIDFAANKICIPGDFADVSLQKKRWNDLQRETKEKFWNYVLIVEMLPSVNEAAIRDTFERINRNSRKLERQEIRHAKYDGWLISEAEAEADKSEWKNFGIVTTARAKRMSDVQFISELFAINLKGQINGFDQDWLDELYAEYEEPEENGVFVEDDFRQTIEGTKGIIEQLVETQPDIKNHLKVLAHFYTLWGFLSLKTNPDFDPAAFAPIYLDFMKKVTAVIKAAGGEEEQDTPEDSVRIYAANSRGASTDLTPRQTRHDQLTLAMAGVAGVVHEDS
ncbi:DUF262 domain-containing protein [uncultured Nitratireductor sp.]|uniref:DUF262 domain-containing protein n=1 Tax=uncultured Nitratireductor sp. TaxID=520953 RepID=UPI00262DAC21|nr:DUF262 domain-containing protein [uncultured Nitratireductor sp.]